MVKTLFQASTWNALALGNFDTVISVRELLRCADTGVGIGTALDGVITFENGAAYKTAPDGEVTVMRPEDSMAFAAAMVFDENAPEIALNGIGQNRAERHNPLAAPRTGKAHRIKMRSVAHVGIIHPHTGKASTQIGKHPQQQTVFFTAVSSCFQATDKKVGKSIVHRLRKAGSVLVELVRFKLLILSLFSLSHGTGKA